MPTLAPSRTDRRPRRRSLRSRHLGGGTWAEAALLVTLVGAAGLLGLGRLGSAMDESVAGSSHSATERSSRYARTLPSPAVHGLAGIAHAAATAGKLSRETVATLRSAAHGAFARGERSATVLVKGLGEIVIDAVPDYTKAHGAKVVVKKGFEPQAHQLRALLNEAWDEAISRGHLRAPSGRRMLEFTGMDTGQREASRLIYSPEGVVSVYMHGGPSSMSRHSFLLKHDPKNPQIARQARYEEIKLATGERRTSDVYGSSVSPKRVAARIEREGIPPGTPILLRACSAAGCPPKGLSIAQQLADATDRPVIAASDIHWRAPKENSEGASVIEVRIEGDPGPGDWRLVLPGAWHTDLPRSGSVDVAQDLRGTHELARLPDGAFDSITMPGDLTQFAGPQNYGAIHVAARKLAPGGTLTLSWKPHEVRRLMKEAKATYRSRFRMAEKAEQNVATRVSHIDPMTALGELRGAGFRLDVTAGPGGTKVATLHAPG